jgi:hypothetical protein
MDILFIRPVLCFMSCILKKMISKSDHPSHLHLCKTMGRDWPWHHFVTADLFTVIVSFIFIISSKLCIYISHDAVHNLDEMINDTMTVNKSAVTKWCQGQSLPIVLQRWRWEGWSVPGDCTTLAEFDDDRKSI